MSTIQEETNSAGKIYQLADVFEELLFPRLCNIDLFNFSQSCSVCHEIVQNYIQQFSETKGVSETLLFADGVTIKGTQRYHTSKGLLHGKYEYSNPEWKLMKFHYVRGELHGPFKSYGYIKRIYLSFKGNYYGGLLHGPLIITYSCGKVRNTIDFVFGKPKGFGRNYKSFTVKDSQRQISTKFGASKKIAFYRDNKLRGIANYDNSGLLHGFAEKFYLNGKTKVKKNFHIGKLDGCYIKKNKDEHTIVTAKFCEGEFAEVKYEIPYLEKTEISSNK